VGGGGDFGLLEEGLVLCTIGEKIGEESGDIAGERGEFRDLDSGVAVDERGVERSEARRCDEFFASCEVLGSLLVLASSFGEYGGVSLASLGEYGGVGGCVGVCRAGDEGGLRDNVGEWAGEREEGTVS
jgi:hypothetical protein